MYAYLHTTNLSPPTHPHQTTYPPTKPRGPRPTSARSDDAQAPWHRRARCTRRASATWRRALRAQCTLQAAALALARTRFRFPSPCHPRVYPAPPSTLARGLRPYSTPPPRSRRTLSNRIRIASRSPTTPQKISGSRSSPKGRSRSCRTPAPERNPPPRQGPSRIARAVQPASATPGGEGTVFRSRYSCTAADAYVNIVEPRALPQPAHPRSVRSAHAPFHQSIIRPPLDGGFAAETRAERVG